MSIHMDALRKPGILSVSLSPSPCRVCQTDAEFRFRGRILQREVAYFECPNCRFVQTETPTWLDEAYDSAINLSDTGILRRNQRNLRLVIRFLSVIDSLQLDVVDFAGGYGVLVRMLRDAGIHAKWHDRFCDNLMARGFETETDWNANLVTAFEVLEHLTHPSEELRDAFARANFVLCSTELMADSIPAHEQWWYYGRDHGQHIAFYRRETLMNLATQFGFHLNTDGKFLHLFSREPLPSWKWQLALKTRCLSPLITSLKLKTLVWSDHETFASRAA